MYTPGSSRLLSQFVAPIALVHFGGMPVRKIHALLVISILCTVNFMPLAVHGQSETGLSHRAEISNATHFDKTPKPLREMFDTGEKPEPARGGKDFEPGRPQAVGNVNKPFEDPLADKSVSSPSALAEIKAATNGTPVDPAARVAPPDTTGDVGPNHYVQWVNLRYAVYTLTRDAQNQITSFNLVSGFPKNGNTLWQGFGGRCQSDNDGDPIVQYDQLADRWILTQFAVSSTPFTQCVAVSTTPDPTGTYFRYSFSYSRNFNDYPKMGVWPDAYYITYNMFRNGSSFIGNQVCALERAQMLVGGAARQACVTTSAGASLVPADLEGSTLPPTNEPNLLMSLTSTTVQFWRFAVNWAAGTGSLTGPTTVSGVAAFSRACSGGVCIPQPGTTNRLDSLGDRLMYRLSYRKFADHESLVINHSVTSGTGVGVRWYELRNATGQTFGSANPVLFQQGTFAPTNDFRWMGSAAMDKTGGIAIGYNISSSTVVPSIRYAYRGPADPLGTLGNETTILVGSGIQTATLTRWGDYSTISVDPVDGCQMVFTSQFQPANGNFNWNTYIHSFKLSTCN